MDEEHDEEIQSNSLSKEPPPLLAPGSRLAVPVGEGSQSKLGVENSIEIDDHNEESSEVVENGPSTTEVEDTPAISKPQISDDLDEEEKADLPSEPTEEIESDDEVSKSSTPDGDDEADVTDTDELSTSNQTEVVDESSQDDDISEKEPVNDDPKVEEKEDREEEIVNISLESDASKDEIEKATTPDEPLANGIDETVFRVRKSADQRIKILVRRYIIPILIVAAAIAAANLLPTHNSAKPKGGAPTNSQIVQIRTERV